MLQDQSRNRTPMPGAQAGDAPPDTGPARAEAGIAAILAARNGIDAQAGEAQEVDWHSPPPGFMAFPAIEPTGFLSIRYGIVAELERLRGIAVAEYARRQPYFHESFAPGELEARLSALSDELRLSALDAAIAGPKAPSAGASAAGPDPILAAIEASRAAQAAMQRWSGGLRFRRMTSADSAEEERLNMAQTSAHDTVIATVPTTAAGRLALLEYLRWQMGLYGMASGEPPDAGSAFWPDAYKALKAALAWDGLADSSPSLADDLELIALGRAVDAATIREQAANDAATVAEERADARMPARPASLFFREGDASFYLRKSAATEPGEPVTPSDIQWMTRRPAQREVWADAPAGSKGSNMVPGKVPQIVPWPEAQARIDEIAAAWDAWEAERDRIRTEEGVHEADEAADRAGEATAALAERIAALPAHTLEGVRAKLRVAAFYGVCEPDDPNPHAGYPGEAAIRSLYRDTPGIEVSTSPSDIRIVPDVALPAGAASPSSDSLADLLRDLEECDRQRDALTEADDETPKDKALYRQLWDLLERIDAHPALSDADLRNKARAAAISLKGDDRVECIGLGSFVSLAKQVVEGLARQPAIEAARAPSMVDQILGCWREWSIVTDSRDEDDDHAVLDRLNQQRSALLDAVEELPAEVEHLPAKALALSWLEYVDLWRHGQARDAYGIDGRLVLDIDTAICGRLATGA